ncbi:MAG: PepSY domain-containing protein [Gammaproteobacteria bacterium]|nr:PepSY domain-containing protein [Gammaproteobacteria bacterium]
MLPFRKPLFWIHLVCGVVAGLVILMMSFTGVLLTYERQIVEAADRAGLHIEAEGRQPLGADELLERASAQSADAARITSLTISHAADEPVRLALGRSGTLLQHPFTGELLGAGSSATREFFAIVTAWHRWFAATGDSRTTARAITGFCNLVFLFLVVSGIYLWVPRIWKWPAIRAVSLFNIRPPSAKARDYNWHHVMGIWMALPLLIIVATAAVFSYPWANDLLYKVAGESPPAFGPRGPGGPPGTRSANTSETATLPAIALEPLLAQARAHSPGWRSISITLPQPGAERVSFSIDLGNGGEPQKRHALDLSPTGEVLAWTPFQDRSTGQRWRSYVRFLHTGEALGLTGQTIAGLASLAAVLMVWTGLALAYRRLLQPLFRR